MSDAHNKVGEHVDAIEAMSEASRRVRAYPDLVKALTRLRNECDLDGLRNRAGFDCWLALADEALAKAGETL